MHAELTTQGQRPHFLTALGLGRRNVVHREAELVEICLHVLVAALLPQRWVRKVRQWRFLQERRRELRSFRGSSKSTAGRGQASIGSAPISTCDWRHPVVDTAVAERVDPRGKVWLLLWRVPRP